MLVCSSYMILLMSCMISYKTLNASPVAHCNDAYRCVVIGTLTFELEVLRSDFPSHGNVSTPWYGIRETKRCSRHVALPQTCMSRKQMAEAREVTQRVLIKDNAPR